MTTSNEIVRIGLAFAVAYAVIYVICTEVNLPLVTYHPVTGEISPMWAPPKSGPAMYWYGWMLTALIGASTLAWIASYVAESWLQRAIMFGCAASVAYFLLYSLALFIYDRATVELEFLKSRWLSVLAAVVVTAAFGFVIPRAWTKRLWHGWIWVVPLGALTVLAYYLAPYFTR